MRTASWILLVLVAALLILGSLFSAGLAYVGSAGDDLLGDTSLADLASGRTDIELAIRGRRGTAAAFALAFAVLLLFVVVGPYRRGDVWAWWAILVSSACFVILTTLRIPTINSSLGVATAAFFCASVLVGLLLDIKRLRRPPA